MNYKCFYTTGTPKLWKLFYYRKVRGRIYCSRFENSFCSIFYSWFKPRHCWRFLTTKPLWKVWKYECWKWWPKNENNTTPQQTGATFCWKVFSSYFVGFLSWLGLVWKLKLSICKTIQRHYKKSTFQMWLDWRVYGGWSLRTNLIKL